VRIYLDTSILVEYCFGRKLQPNRYKSVRALFEKINSKEITGIVSFYALHELFIFAIDNFSPDVSRYIGKTAFEDILKNRVEMIPLLNREDRIRYSNRIKMNDVDPFPRLPSNLRHSAAENM